MNPAGSPTAPTGIGTTPLTVNVPDLDTDDFRDAMVSPVRPKNVNESISRILEEAAAIITCITEGKSVTTANKKRIVEHAKSIMESTRMITTAASVPDRPPPVDISDATAQTLRQTIKEEISKALKQTSIVPQVQSLSYASAVKQAPRTLPSKHISKPSIIVSSKKGSKSRDVVMQEWRNSISFRNSSYAPSKIQTVSNSRLRVEFDTIQQQEDTLSRLNHPNSQVSAEPTKRLKPMIELKGLYTDTACGDIVNLVKVQNELIRTAITADEDIVFKFKRRNKNDKLYNAVLMVTPPVYKKMLELSSINVDHQRIHVAEFVPLLQCYKCLQYGHTQKRCENDKTTCSHCGDSDHTFSTCHNKNKLPLKCSNCLEHNKKYKTNKSTDHSATSHFCTIYQQMKDKIILRTDYG